MTELVTVLGILFMLAWKALPYIVCVYLCFLVSAALHRAAGWD